MRRPLLLPMVLAAVVLAGSAAAQSTPPAAPGTPATPDTETPAPVLPPAAPAPPPPSATPIVGALPVGRVLPGRIEVWSLSLGLQGAYDSNPLYGNPPPPGQDAGDFLTRFNARLARLFPLKRARLAVSADGGGSLYQDLSELNRFNWGVGVASGYDFSRRLTADVQASTGLGYARDFVPLDPASLAPYTPTRFDSGAAVVRFVAARDTTVHLDAGAQRYTFQGGTPLTDGKGLTVSVAADRDLSTACRLSGAGEYERISNGPKYEIERLVGRWKQGVARAWTAQLEAGLGRYRTITTLEPILTAGAEDPTAPRVSPILRGAVTGSHLRHSLRLSAGRTVSQSYGLGAVGVNTFASGAYAYGPVGGVTVSASVDASRASQLSLDIPPNAFDLRAGVRWQAKPQLHFALEADRWDRRGGTRVANSARWSGWMAALSAAYAFAWR